MWTFGSTELLALIGHLVTILGFALAAWVALRGIRTFEDWKKEQVWERRIEIVVEALALTYESKYVFESIRSPMSFEHEWQDMPKLANETDEQWGKRGPYYAVRKRIVDNKDFFERAFKLQPRCMALLGPKVEHIFMLMHQARRRIEVSSEMLAWKVHNPTGPMQEQNPGWWDQLRIDIWHTDGMPIEKDTVGRMLLDFRSQMEALCRPIVDKELKGP